MILEAGKGPPLPGGGRPPDGLEVDPCAGNAVGVEIDRDGAPCRAAVPARRRSRAARVDQYVSFDGNLYQLPWKSNPVFRDAYSGSVIFGQAPVEASLSDAATEIEGIVGEEQQ